MTLEYDPDGDFPAYFNPLSLANSLVAVEWVHPDKYYDAIDPATTPALVKTVQNSAGGYDTYVFIGSRDAICRHSSTQPRSPSQS